MCFFAVFYFYCPCRKTDDDDDDDDDKYGVRSTSTRDSIQYAVTCDTNAYGIIEYVV